MASQRSPRANSYKTEGVMHGVEHYENFPVASWLCPARMRPAVLAVYGFARTADDLADEGDASPAERLADLALYRSCLEHVAANPNLTTATLPTPRWAAVFLPLAQSLLGLQHTHRMDTAPILQQLRELLTAFEQDCHNPRYATHAEVLNYCSRSANPVGRIMLALHFGTLEITQTTPQALLPLSDAVCTGLQLVNFWQDFGQDWARGRCYLAQEVLDTFNSAHKLGGDQALSYNNLMQHPALPQLLAEQVNEAKNRLESGLPLPRQVSGRLGLELELVIQGGLRVAEKLARIRYDTRRLDRLRPKLNAWDAAVVFARGVWAY